MSIARELVETAQALEATGNVGTSGNLSVRRDDGFLITPSGVPYATLTPDQLVPMNLQGEATGPGIPSSEWRFHLDIYGRRDDVNAVVHAHPPNATALACRGLDIPAFHYEVAFAGGKDIRCAPYATFGSQQLSDHVVDALAERRACLMANHGMVAVGRDMAAAMALAERVEQLALMYRLCLSVGEPNLLSDAEMARVLDKFRDYGQR